MSMDLELSPDTSIAELMQVLNIDEETFFQRVLNNFNEDEPVIEERIDISLSEAYLNYTYYLVERSGLGGQSQYSYRKIVKEFCHHIKAENKDSLAKITKSDIDFFLTKNAISNATYNKKLAAVRNFIVAYLIEDQELPLNNVTKKIKGLARQSIPRGFSEEESIKILRTAFNRKLFRDYLLIALMLFTGLRVSEVAALKVKDINMRGKQIRVENGKGQKARSVPMIEELEILLKQYFKIQPRIELVPRYNHPYMPLFLAASGKNKGGKMHVRSIQKIVESVLLESQVFSGSAHSLRHTFAILCHEHGIAVADIQKMLGHKHFTTTFIYLQKACKQLRRKLEEKYPLAKISLEEFRNEC